MARSEHATVAVPDDHRAGKAARRQPLRRKTIVRDRFRRGLKRAAFGRAAHARGEYVVATAIERQHRESQFGQHRRQKPRAAGVKIHRVAVEIQRSAFGLAFRLVKCAVDGNGVGCDGDELGAHGYPQRVMRCITPSRAIMCFTAAAKCIAIRIMKIITVM